MGHYTIRNILTYDITVDPNRVRYIATSSGILLKVMKDSLEYPYLTPLKLFQENSYFQWRVNELQYRTKPN